MLVETKAKVAVFSIALGAYLPQFPELVPEFEAQFEAFKATLSATVEVVDGGKQAMGMCIMKTISGACQLSEFYTFDFNDDVVLIGHSGSGDADFSTARKASMEVVPVFHGKAGGGFLTRFYPKAGPVTYLGITQDADGHFKFVVSEGVIEDGPTLGNGDTTFRTRFSIGAREWNNRWCECGPTHHFAAAQGSWTDTICKVAKILDVPVKVVC